MALDVLWATAAVVGFLIAWFVVGNWLADSLNRHDVFIPFWLDVLLLGPVGWLLCKVVPDDQE